MDYVMLLYLADSVMYNNTYGMVLILMGRAALWVDTMCSVLTSVQIVTVILPYMVMIIMKFTSFDW